MSKSRLNNYKILKKIVDNKIKGIYLFTGKEMEEYNFLNFDCFCENNLPKIICYYPENSTHTSIQVEKMKFLIDLYKSQEKEMQFFIFTYSTFIVEAINKYSEKEGIKNETYFYLNEFNNGEDYTFIDRTNKKSVVFKDLNRSFTDLIFE